MSPKYIITKIGPKEKLENITYGCYKSNIFGKLLLGLSDNSSICYLAFVDGPFTNLNDLIRTFPKAQLFKNEDLVSNTFRELFESSNNNPEIKILLKGTEFENKVWEQLTYLEEGNTITYEEVARLIGHPKSVRAVANALRRNVIAIIVPCHRVISKNGAINKYKWGNHRKLQLLRHERIIAKKRFLKKYFGGTA